MFHKITKNSNVSFSVLYLYENNQDITTFNNSFVVFEKKKQSHVFFFVFFFLAGGGGGGGGGEQTVCWVIHVVSDTKACLN